MIDDVASLLDAIASKEAALIDSKGISHPPTIGGMYEGLTARVLKASLPDTPSLQVVSGFIRREDGSDSREIDCMVVLGDVEDLPYSSKKRVTRLSQVVAVIEVKKSLYAEQMSDAHEIVRSVRSIEPDDEYARHGQLDHAFSLITRTPLTGPIEDLPPLHARLFHLLRVHANSPACIVLGYYGFKRHKSFRRALGRYLQSIEGHQGYGPLSLPDVVLNASVAAVKNISLPWSTPLQAGLWPLYLTAPIASPSAILLEALWTRLAMRGILDDAVFGDDLSLEPWLMLAALNFDEARNRWGLKTYEHAKAPQRPTPPSTWSPVELTPPQYSMLEVLCRSQEGSMRIPLLADEGLSEADFTFLNSHGLVGRDPNDPSMYVLLTRKLECVILPDGRFVAGENNSGRLSRWVANLCAAHVAAKQQTD